MPTQKRALLSVYDKTGLVPFATRLAAKGFELVSTGGTAKALREAGLEVTDVAAITGQVEIFGGRVKSLHPKIHGGILARLDDPSDTAEMEANDIVPITIVATNLYPFEDQWKAAAPGADLIEWIDIGGPAMVRAAAKNHAYVSVVVDPADYEQVMEGLDLSPDQTCEMRRSLAAKAFRMTASYDVAVSDWIVSGTESADLPERQSLSGSLVQTLRYGENPHQTAAAYRSTNPFAPSGLLSAQQVQGKALSYNNLNDADAALRLVKEFDDPACVIVKHANPCGVALGDDLHSAYRAAKSCDPVSAFGGIVALNRPLDAAVSSAIVELFTEVVLAPSADEGARAIFAQKPNLRLMLSTQMFATNDQDQQLIVKPLTDGFLLQSRDNLVANVSGCRAVTQKAPTDVQLNNLVFGQRIAKHVASNTIVLVKNGQTVGIGAGQMSRIDALRIALWKAEDAGLDVHGAAMASDAFFPFPDVVEAAAKAGIEAVIHPGGSMNDTKVIDVADALGLTMVTTGTRHFRH